jgi:mannobiose 2-epimerase
MSTTESYGHDIECSWLLHEAALVLGDSNILNKVEPVVCEVAKASEKGLQADGSMIYEGEPDGSHFDCERHWWVQAEAVVGFFNLYQHFGDEAALTKALNCWQYIKEHLIDYERGEWYWSIRADGSTNQDDDHAGFWKCPYHNGRMCLELIERIKFMLEP